MADENKYFLDLDGLKIYNEVSKDNEIINTIEAQHEDYSSIIRFSNVGTDRLFRLKIEGNSIEQKDGTKIYVENPIISIRGKNLAETIYSHRNSRYQPLIKINALDIVPNKQYMISFDVEQDVSKVLYLNENFSTSVNRYLKTTKGKNIIKSAFSGSTSKFEILFKNNDLDITDYDIINLQIEDGETATDYEEHIGKTFMLNGVILRKCENIADTLYFDISTSKWVIDRYVGEDGSVLNTPLTEILNETLQIILNSTVVSDNMCVEVHCKNGTVPGVKADIMSRNYTETILTKNACNTNENALDFIHCENGRFYHENGEEFFLQGMNEGDHYSLNGTTYLREFHADWFKQWNDKVNTIRLLMSSKWFEFDNEPFVYRESGFIYLDRVIEEAKKNDIRLILDMHRNQGGFQGWDNNGFRTEEKIERLAKLMGEIARRYKDEPCILGYGVWNEPVIEYINSNPAESIAKYEEIVQYAINEIRKYDKKHIIFIQEPYGHYSTTSDVEIKNSNITWGFGDDWKEYIPMFEDGMKNICYEWHCYLKPNFYGNERFGYYKSKVTTNILNHTYGGTVVDAYDNTKDEKWQTVSFKPSTWNNKPVNVYRPSFKIQYYPTGTKLYIRNIKYEILNNNGEIIETDTFLPNDIIKSDTNSSGVVELDGENVMVFGVNSDETSYSDILPMTYFTKDADTEDSRFYYEVKVVLPEGTDAATLNENRGIVCNHKEYYVEDVDGILDRYNISTYYNEHNKAINRLKQCGYNGVFIGETGHTSSNEDVKTMNILKQLEDFRDFIANTHVGFCYFILGQGQYEDFLKYSEEARQLIRDLYIDSTEYSDTKVYRVGDIENISDDITILEAKIADLETRLSALENI